MSTLEVLGIGKNIKNKRKLKGLTQQELADKSSISRSYLGDIEGGRYNPSIETLDDIAHALGIHITSLIGEEPPKKVIRIPVLGKIVAGVPLEAVADHIGYEEITEEMASTGEFFALKIKGDSMEPKFSNGDVVIVRKQPNLESGEIGIVIINGQDATIKKVQKHSTGINLIPTNPNYDPVFYTNKDIENLPVEILGKVVELRAKF